MRNSSDRAMRMSTKCNVIARTRWAPIIAMLVAGTALIVVMLFIFKFANPQLVHSYVNSAISACILFVVTFGIWNKISRRRLVRKLRAAEYALCPNCCYLITDSARCPECGETFDNNKLYEL